MGAFANVLAQGPQPTTGYKSPTQMAAESAALANARVGVENAKSEIAYRNAEAEKQKVETAKAQAALAQQAANQKAAQAAAQAAKTPEDFIAAYQANGGDQTSADAYQKDFDLHAKEVDAHNTSQLTFKESQNKRRGGLLEGVLAATDPVARARQLSQAQLIARQEGLDPLPDSPDPEQLTAALNLNGIEGSIQQRAKAKREAEKADADARTAAANANVAESTQGSKISEAASTAAKLAAEAPVTQAIAAATLANPNLLSPKDQSEADARKVTADLAQKKFDQDLKDFTEKVRHNKADEGETRRYHDMSAEGVTLTPEAKTKMAEMFAQTGALPNLGMGKEAAKNRSDIINQAAKDFPQVDFATNKAGFQANTASLRKLQTTSDQVDGFEKTAGKNIDVFLKSASKIVDTGSPALNMPVRAISDLVLGSEAMSAFKAARETALTEAAKVLESSNGAGGVTVAGRTAVKTLSDPDATLGQQVAAMKVLKQDMANRKQSNQEQIQAIRDRISGKQQDGLPGGITLDEINAEIERRKVKK